MTRNDSEALVNHNVRSKFGFFFEFLFHRPMFFHNFINEKLEGEQEIESKNNCWQPFKQHMLCSLFTSDGEMQKKKNSDRKQNFCIMSN